MTKLKKDLENLIRTEEDTDDCCGKWDLDFPILSITTRGWSDNTAKCEFIVNSGTGIPTTILESRGYLEAKTRKELVQKCRDWYLKNLGKAIKILYKKTREETEHE